MRPGRWVDPVRSWHDTTVSYCQVCGRLIPRRSWVFDGGRGDVTACSPECEGLYEEYLKPEYGVINRNENHEC